MQNFKISKKIPFVMAFFITLLSASQTPNAQRAPIITLITGPVGQLIAPPSATPQSLSCIVNGITITTSGTSSFTYSVPPVQNTSCNVLANFTGLGNWTGSGNTTGFITYTFNPPVLGARVSYSAVNQNDSGTITTNSASPILFNETCGFSLVGNVVTSNLTTTSFGNCAITLTSATPFSTVTLTNTGGQSGWVVGDPCKFVVTPVPPSSTIVNCPKITLDTRYYSTFEQNTTLSVFTAGSGGGCPQATINGVPCTAANVTIEPVTPLPFGCTFNANGTIRIPAGTLPFYTSNIYNYRFRSIANPNIYSVPYRVDFGIQPRVLLSNLNNVYLTVKPTDFNGVPNPGGIANPYGTASNPIKNVLTGSTIYTSTTGGSGTAIANSNAASAVTVTETTNPTDPYFMINSNGDIVYRPTINTSTVTIPALPQIKRELKFRVCLAGSNLFCNDGSSSINYFYPPLRPAPSTTSLDSFTISPNPIKAGQCQISFEKTIDNATLEVHALTGEKLHTEKLDNTTEELLLLDKLPKGIYVLKIITENQTVSKKISIE